MSLHITIIALGSTGDILPYATLGHHLRSVGYEVLFVTSENYRSLISGLKLSFLGVPGDAKSVIEASGANIFSLFRSFADLSRGLSAVLDPEHPEINHTDLILNQLPIGVYGYDLAERLGVPMIQAAVIPLTPTKSFPMVGWPAASSKNPTYNRLSCRVYEQLTWLYMRQTINQWRREKLGLQKRPIRNYWPDGQSGRPETLYGFSTHVLERPTDWDDRIHICGYWFLDEADWSPPDRLSAFLDAGEPPLFIGFGSMPISDPVQTTKLLVKAVQESGHRAIFHAGWADIGGMKLPDAVLKIDYAPYQWLFPKMSAVIHHGGSGTTGSALWSGVPSLAVPFLFDQFFWGKRIAALGIGHEPIPFKKLDSDKLCGAIQTLTNDLIIKQKASILGGKIRAEAGVENAAKIIRELVEKP